MLDICVCGAACDDSECSVLGCLEFVEICVGDDGLPEVFPYSMTGRVMVL